MTKDVCIELSETTAIDLFKRARQVSVLLSDIREAFDPVDFDHARWGFEIGYERLQTYAILADEIAQSLQSDMDDICEAFSSLNGKGGDQE